MKNSFKRALRLLQKINSKLAYQISNIDASALEFCQTEQGELNLKRFYDSQTYYYHSPKNAIHEAEYWFKSLDLKNITVLFVYGVGLGYYYEAAKNWLKENRKHQLVFLEEDLGVLHRLCEIPRGVEIFNHPQVKIFHFTNILEDQALFNEISWTYILSPFLVSALNLYSEVNQEGFLELHHRLTHDAIQKKVLVDEYLQYGVAFFRNFYPNLLELPHSKWGNKLFGKFKNIPAIICGAGPSLNKNFETLTKLTHKALIFAGSSSLNATIPKGLIPHFGAAIDPNRAQYQRIASVQSHKIPFFYRNRLFHDALVAIKGPRLYLSGTGGYEVADWFDKELSMEGLALDEGHNVINFCIEIAHALGCNPIILVGVDLAFTNQQHYAEGVISHLQLTEKDFERRDDFDSLPLAKQDIYGQPVYTLWKWVTEAEWISKFAESHPEVSLINATEGGIGFKGVLNQPLAEVAQTSLYQEADLYGKVRSEIEHLFLPSSISRPHIEGLMQILQSSLQKCMDHFETLKQEMQNLETQIQQGTISSDSLETSTTMLTELAIEDEIGYQYLLDTFNLIFMRVHHRTIQSLTSPKGRLTSKTRSKKKIELHLKRLNFLKDVARVNIELINRAL